MKSSRAAARQTLAAEDTAKRVEELHEKVDALTTLLTPSTLGSTGEVCGESGESEGPNLAELITSAVEAAVAPLRTEIAELRRHNGRSVNAGR